MLEMMGSFDLMLSLPSGVNSPQFTGPLCPANTCIVLPEGTGRKIIDRQNLEEWEGKYTAIAKVSSHLNQLIGQFLLDAILRTRKI